MILSRDSQFNQNHLSDEEHMDFVSLSSDQWQNFRNYKDPGRSKSGLSFSHTSDSRPPLQHSESMKRHRGASPRTRFYSLQTRVNLIPHLGLLPLEFLLGDFLPCVLLRLGNGLLPLGQDHFNVAWRAHVSCKRKAGVQRNGRQGRRELWSLTVDASVSSVGPPAHLGGTVHLDVFNHQVICIQTLKHHQVASVNNAFLMAL